MPHIHVISFQNPVPPDYGGVIDVYHKLKALKDMGWTITLHTYNYRGRQEIAPSFFTGADRVIYYRRDESPLRQFSILPYIVGSRRAPGLLADLLEDDAPILFEGLHTTWLLPHPALRDRIKIVRAHNVEHDYYRGLASAEKSFSKRMFYSLEAWRLKRYEPVLAHADVIAAISEGDARYFGSRYKEAEIMLLPCFYDDSPPPRTPGDKEYVLYQGSLDVAENILAALRIIRGIAPRLPEVRFVIAGRRPGAEIMEAAAGVNNVEIIPDPPAEEMERMLLEARVNLLVTDQATGVKLKLLHALCRGAHIIVNPKMVEGTGLDSCCTVAASDEELAAAISEKIREPFLDIRKLPDVYSNLKNARLLSRKISDIRR